MCHWYRTPFGDSKWAPDRTHPWIAKKPLFNSGFVKLVKEGNDWFEISYSVIERFGKILHLEILHIYLISWIRDCWNLFSPPELAFYPMQNESLISFGPKYLFKMVWYTVKKMLVKTFIFCSKVPSECGRCLFRDPKFKTSPVGDAPGPPTNVFSLHRPWGSIGPFPPEMARPLNGSSPSQTHSQFRRMRKHFPSCFYRLSKSLDMTHIENVKAIFVHEETSVVMIN